MLITRFCRLVREPELANMAPTQGQGRICDRTKGRPLGKGVASPRGLTRSASPELAYEPDGPTDPIQPTSSPNTPSVQELLLRVLAR